MAKKSPQLRRTPTAQLARELDRRRQRLPKLERRRDQLIEQLREVEDQIEDLGGFDQPAATARKKATRKKSKKKSTKKAAGRKRARNEVSLVETITKVLRGRSQPMRIAELAEAVRKSGYKSNASNFQQIVSQTLSKDDRFKAVERGKYQLAG